MQIPISLQLYTLRDQLAQDELGTLERVAALGYQGVECGFPQSAAFLDKCRELNLKITACHVGIPALENELDAVIAQNKEMENSFIIVPWIGPELRGSAQNWIDLGKRLEVIGAKLKDEGFTLCYHNHDFEFTEQFDGKYGFDLLYDHADAGYLQVELDTYWVQKGGANPVEYIKKYAGRVPLVHLKDMDAAGNFAEVGTGSLDWPAIFAASEAQGVVTYVVEQDICPGDPFDSIAISIENLRKMGKI